MKTPELVVSTIPHVHGGNSVQKMMINFMIALLPAAGMSVYFFGPGAIVVIAISVVSAVAWEFIIQKVMGRPLAISNLTGAASGLVFAMMLPPTAPWWMICIGTFIIILLGKEVYGGLGNNPFNGVLIAWLVLQMSFRGEMAEWIYVAGELLTESTPLEILKFEGLESIPEYFTIADLFIGRTTGFIGEVSAIALLIGGVFLIVRRVISWHIPVSFMIGVVFLSGIFWLMNPEECADPIFHLLAGGVFLAAFFVATDMPSSPTTPIGMLTYGFLCGLVTMVIRQWGAWDDGAFYSVFLISMLTPLLDKIKPKAYGR
ncbi:MAG: RnfABCDGE type electron transport complex subunit D [Proteobacteria bacterium]|nr:RnfABCDGE type electron transport complex subunit D [Pseudomonadota bacterium]